MPHVLIAGRIHADGMAVLKAAPGVTHTLVEEVSVESYLPHLAEADAIVLRTQPFQAVQIAQAPRLKIASRHGVGYDAVDVVALNSRQIPLAVVGDVNSRAVAEHTLMLMLAAARRTVSHHSASVSGSWQVRNKFESQELDGKTLLLVGFGRIGRRVAQLAQAFGMKVMAHDPFVTSESMTAAGVEAAVSLNAALAVADYVSLHVPASPAGAVIGRTEIAQMKPTAIIINAARGGLVDEAALDAALCDDRLAAAGLDVFVQEPPPADHPLLHNPRVTISPHSAGLTDACAARMGVAAVQNVLDHFAGKLAPALVVNAKAIGYGG